MIGQTKLINEIDILIKNKRFPRFSIITGLQGSGKKMLANHIANSLNAPCVLIDGSAESVRTMIENAYTLTSPVVYLMADADNMSAVAKNAILKVTEEPPQQAYFIITLEMLANTLDTIKSRGFVFNMEIYSKADIVEYYEGKVAYTLEADTMGDICETPGDVDKMISAEALKLYEYTLKVVDNIAEVSGANSFKIGKALDLGNGEGFDLRLFLRTFVSLCHRRVPDGYMKYSRGVIITLKYLRELRTTGINKSHLFDMWLLDIRKAWMNL